MVFYEKHFHSSFKHLIHKMLNHIKMLLNPLLQTSHVGSDTICGQEVTQKLKKRQACGD